MLPACALSFCVGFFDGGRPLEGFDVDPLGGIFVSMMTCIWDRCSLFSRKG